jgi:hypothetical protein
MEWPALTRDWWEALTTLEGAEDFTKMQWHYLLDTALIHAAVWGLGDFGRAGELGKRMEAFGVTPGAMARLSRAKDGGAKSAPPSRSKQVDEPAPAAQADPDAPPVLSMLERARLRAAK